MARKTRLPTYLEIDALLEMLDFTDENLESAAMAQPTLFLEASRYMIDKVRVRAMYERKLDIVMARYGIRYREMKDEDGKKRLTEGGITQRVMVKPRVIELQRKLDHAKEAEKYGESLRDAYRMRKDMIKVVADTRMAEGMTKMKVNFGKAGRYEFGRIVEDTEREMKEKHRNRRDEDE